MFGICVPLGNDMYALARSEVLRWHYNKAEKRKGKSDDDKPPPPAAGSGDAAIAIAPADVAVELADTGEGYPHESFVSIAELAVAGQIAAALAVVGGLQVIVPPVSVPAMRASLPLPRFAPAF